MTARRVIVPGAMPSRDANGRNLPSKLRFYEPDTAYSTPATVYTDNTLTVAHEWPLESDAGGRFPQIWADDANTFDVVWSDQTFDRAHGRWQDLAPLDDATLASVALAESAQEAAESARDEAQEAAEAAQEAAAATISGAAEDVPAARDVFNASTLPDGVVLRVLNQSVAGDRGGGDFAYDNTDTTSADDDGRRVIVDGHDRRFKRIHGKDYWDASKFGVRDGATGAQNVAGLLDIFAEATALMAANPGFRSLPIALDPDLTYPISSGLLIPYGVTLVGGLDAPGALLEIDGDMSASYMIDTATGSASSKRYIGVHGLHLLGDPTGLLGYVRLRGTNRSRVIHVLGRGGCAGRGFWVDDTNSNGVFEDLYFVQCCNAALGGGDPYTGAVDIDGPDHTINRVIGQVGDVATGGVYTDGRKCGIRLSGGPIRANTIRGELSEIGIVYDALTKSAVTDALADLNQGGGFLAINTAANNTFKGQVSAGNSRAGDGSYDAFTFGDTGSHANTLDLIVTTQSGNAQKMRYGVYDGVGGGSGARNTVTAIGGGNWNVAPFFNEHETGFSTTPQANVPLTWTNGDTSPDVGGWTNYRTFNTSATTITTFDNMARGQTITVECADGNTTISHGTSANQIKTPNAQDYLLVSGRFYRFTKDKSGVIVMHGENAATTQYHGSFPATTFAAAGSTGDVVVIGNITVTGVKSGQQLLVDFSYPNTSAANVAGSSRNIDVVVWGKAVADNTVYVIARNMGVANKVNASSLTIQATNKTRDL